MPEKSSCRRPSSGKLPALGPQCNRQINIHQHQNPNFSTITVTNNTNNSTIYSQTLVIHQCIKLMNHAYTPIHYPNSTPFLLLHRGQWSRRIPSHAFTFSLYILLVRFFPQIWRSWIFHDGDHQCPCIWIDQWQNDAVVGLETDVGSLGEDLTTSVES